MAAALVAFGANAQYDLSASWVAYSAGESVSDNPMNGTFTITNEGAADIAIGDTVCYGIIVDDGPYGVDLTGGVYNFIVLEEPFVAGTSLTVGLVELAWAELGITVNACATAYGVGTASVMDHVGDSNPDDNRECISYMLPEAPDDSGIEDFETALANVYVANGSLMIVNSGVTVNEQANLNIVSVNGQLVQTSNFVLTQGTSTVDVSSLSTGIYIVSIEVNGAVISKKVSIQ